jgi:carbamoyltransferase|tara:strand:+ start:15825 stop:17660 length:1836 start_codon:yes stop_codon:yes gene_type:complete
MTNKRDIWIAGITRGHNASVCLLKNGEVVFAIEEERLSRRKYDGTPTTAMMKILEYTDTLEYLVICHTTEDLKTIQADFSGEDIYTAFARKTGLISRDDSQNNFDGSHPQVINLGKIHHKLHAACAFYRSGFESAVAVIVDGAGSVMAVAKQDHNGTGMPSVPGWETESIFSCNYPNDIRTLYKHVATASSALSTVEESSGEAFMDPEGHTFECVISDTAGIVKTYEAVTYFCGWHFIEAGKTMGLFPYGKENPNIPKLFGHTSFNLTNRNFVVPSYPNGAYINADAYEFTQNEEEMPTVENLTFLENRRDLAYAVQTQSQDEIVRLIRKAVDLSGNKNVVISGGYGLNCVANYHYLEALKDEGINIYVEPVSNDAGTSIGAAMLVYKDLEGEFDKVDNSTDGLYLGFEYNYTDDEIEETAQKYNATVSDATNEDVIKLITSKNIVSLFQGRSEAGPRALGNRSILYDPTDPNGKDFVNSVKHREYFRPFAGSILQDDVHEWFDLRGMEDSPSMMYAVNCQPGIEEKIPAIIHVDGTCRIQTVTREQNQHYYDIIKAFKDATGCPIIFNTSFNLGGEPLVETLDDAIRTLASCDIEYLYLPEYGKLITVTN